MQSWALAEGLAKPGEMKESLVQANVPVIGPPSPTRLMEIGEVNQEQDRGSYKISHNATFQVKLWARRCRMAN